MICLKVTNSLALLHKHIPDNERHYHNMAECASAATRGMLFSNIM